MFLSSASGANCCLQCYTCKFGIKSTAEKVEKLEYLLKFQIQKRREGMNVNVEEIAEELKVKTTYINRYNWLFIKYQEKYYYWELVQTVRKVIVVLVGKFLTKRIVLSLSLHLGCLVIIYGAHSYCFPYEEIEYEDDSDDGEDGKDGSNMNSFKKCRRFCVKKCKFHVTMGMSNNSIEYFFLNCELSFLLSCLIRTSLMIEISNEDRQNNITSTNMKNSTMFIPTKLATKSEVSYLFILAFEWFGMVLFVIAVSIFLYQVSLALRVYIYENVRY